MFILHYTEKDGDREGIVLLNEEDDWRKPSKKVIQENCPIGYKHYKTYKVGELDGNGLHTLPTERFLQHQHRLG